MTDDCSGKIAGLPVDEMASSPLLGNQWLEERASC
jgi:hypothetical protein